MDFLPLFLCFFKKKVKKSLKCECRIEKICTFGTLNQITLLQTYQTLYAYEKVILLIHDAGNGTLCSGTAVGCMYQAIR